MYRSMLVGQHLGGDYSTHPLNGFCRGLQQPAGQPVYTGTAYRCQDVFLQTFLYRCGEVQNIPADLARKPERLIMRHVFVYREFLNAFEKRRYLLK